jgi:hypothetical protein
MYGAVNLAKKKGLFAVRHCILVILQFKNKIYVEQPGLKTSKLFSMASCLSY